MWMTLEKIVSELCMVKKTILGISSSCIVQVDWWEEWKELCICPHHRSVILWGGGRQRKGTLVMHLHAPRVSLHSPATQQEKGASELWQPRLTRAAQCSSSLCREAGLAHQCHQYGGSLGAGLHPHLSWTVPRAPWQRLESWANTLRKIPPWTNFAHEHKSIKGLWKNHSDLCVSSASLLWWLRRIRTWYTYF